MNTHRPFQALIAIATVVVALGSTSARAAMITELNNDFRVQTSGLGGAGASSSTLSSFNAGATADLLVVAISTEIGDGADVTSVTYNGVDLLEAEDATHTEIWYTTSPYTGGAADVVVNFSAGVVNGVGFGVVSATSGGLPIILHASNSSSSSDTVSLTTTLDDAFVVTSFNSNSFGGSVSLDAPQSPIYTSSNHGSARGAAGYVEDVDAGIHNYSWNVDNQERAASAAAFVAVPEPGSVGLAALGVLGLIGIRRRRRR